MIELLRLAGMSVRTVPQEFGRGCLDVEWLPRAGERGLVVLTKDKAIRRSPLEIAAVREAKVPYFALSHGNLTAPQMAAAILAARPHIEAILRSRKGRRAIVARISSKGAVRVLETWP
ncbi:MAG: hypothetical protein MUC36_03775 [Planctomycetes bacterium]|nr:hypothetical protein [Planctomycetota bacterium]